MENNTEFTIYLTAITNGASYNSKVLNFKFSTLQSNLLSKISSTTQLMAEVRQKEEEERIRLELERLKPNVTEVVQEELPPEIPLNFTLVDEMRII